MDRQELIERLLLLEREAEERKRLDEEMQVNSRLTNIERITANLDGKDMTPDAPRAGVFAELQGSLPPIPVPESTMLPFDVEFGKPTGSGVTTDVAIVTLQPCDGNGNSFASADTVTVYVASDRSVQPTARRGWTTSKILSFIRFAPWVSGTPNIEGVLIGEAPDASPVFAARLVREDAGLGGEYDQWKEVVFAGAGAWSDKAGGRTHTSTSKSLWEFNNLEGLPAHATTGTVVFVWVDWSSSSALEYTFASEDPGKVKVDALDPRAYLEDQLLGGTAPGTVVEENLKVEKVNVAGDNDIIKIRHTTSGATASGRDITLSTGEVLHRDAADHLVGSTPPPS